MKTNKFFAALLLGLSVVACAPKEAPAVDGEDALAALTQEKTIKDYTPSKALVDSVSYLVGINFGSFVKGYNFGDLNYSQVVKGIKDFVNAKGDMNDPAFNEQFRVNPELLNDMFNNYLENRQHVIALQNKEKSEAFLAANAKKDGVEVTASGLQYKILEAGNDVKAGPADTVWVRYKGTLIDGTVFDQVEEGAEPVALTLNRVIKGWQEGLQLVGEGGKLQLFIPSDLGYGEQGASQTIEPNSALIFDVEVAKVGKVAED